MSTSVDCFYGHHDDCPGGDDSGDYEGDAVCDCDCHDPEYRTELLDA